MSEPLPPDEPPPGTHPPVPDAPPMPSKAGGNVGVATVAIVGGVILLALIVLDTAGGLDGLLRILYVVPALLLVAAGAMLLREAASSGRR